MSKIQKELAEATGVNVGRGESINDKTYLKKLLKATAELDDKAWAKLSKPAQDWFNEAAEAANKKQDIVGFEVPKEEPEDEPAPRRRRSAEADDDQPAKGKVYEPAKGDKVLIVTARDKEVTGTVVDPDDAGELVLDVNGEETGYRIDRLKSITQVIEKAEEPPKRRRAAEDDNAPPEKPAKAKGPAVGDTVEVENIKSGRVKVGNVIELNDETIALKDAAGEEIEFDLAKVKVTVKVDNSKPAEEEAPKRRRAAADDETDTKLKADEKTRTNKDDNGGVSVTVRAREIMCEDPLNPMPLADLQKAIDKEKLTCNPNTLKMVHADCVKMFGILKVAKHLK